MKLRNRKTGEIWDVGKVLANVHPCRETLAQLCEDREDAPKETPIEVKKIQKIIRAWAEVNGVKELKYIVDENSLQDIFRNSISFNRVLDLKDGEEYTIAELCGEDGQ